MSMIFKRLHALSKSLSRATLLLPLVSVTSLIASARQEDTPMPGRRNEQTFLSAAAAFKSKPAGQRLEEGWNLLATIRQRVFPEESTTNFSIAPLKFKLSQLEVVALLGKPDLVYTYTNIVLGTNVTFLVYTCGKTSNGTWMQFEISFSPDQPMLWLSQESLIPASEREAPQSRVPADLKEQYLRIIGELKRGKLVPDSTGLLKLRGDSMKASISGEILMSKSATNLLIVFKTWTGRGANMEGYLYSDQRLSDSIVGQDLGLRVGQMLLTVEKRIDDNWYRVAYRID